MSSTWDKAMHTANPQSHAHAFGPDEFSHVSHPMTSQGSHSSAENSIPVRSGLNAPAFAGEGNELEPSDCEDIGRENRFHGPASTWRNHTYEERQLAAAISQQRANNLSIHLYNAHALKARAREPHVPNITPWTSKNRWMSPDQPHTISFQPDRNWTAWPLPPDEVPRRGEDFCAALAFEEDGETYRNDIPWTPSADLHQEILALMLRKAKDRFTRRQWAESELCPEHGDWTKVGRENQSDGGSERGSDDVEIIDVEMLPPANASIPERTYTSSSIAEPTFLADDERANVILQPSIRHILTKLDELLLGLHKSRHGHRRGHSAARARSRPATRISRSRSKVASSRKRSNQRSERCGETSSGSEHFDLASISSSSEHSESETSAANQEKRRSSGPSMHPLGLRDWSEVLGVASLVGWNSAVIARAARRCASLFGESISFRTMPETAVDDIEDEIVHYVPEMVPDFSDLGSESEREREESSSIVIKGLFCPFQHCTRHHQAYEKAWRWREHLRRSHKLRPNEIERVESGVDRPTNSSTGKDKRSAHSSLPTNKMIGGVHCDDFLQPIHGNGRRGKDKRPRRRRSTAELEVPKKHRTVLDEEETRPCT